MWCTEYEHVIQSSEIRKVSIPGLHFLWNANLSSNIWLVTWKDSRQFALLQGT